MIGIDVGTSAVKVACFDERGCVLASRILPSGGYVGASSSDPAGWYDVMIEAAEAVYLDVQGKVNLAGLSIASTTASLVVIDDEGKPLDDVLMWYDCRAYVEAQSLTELCAVSVSAASFAAKLLWTAKHRTERVSYVFDAASWLCFALSGAATIPATCIDFTFGLPPAHWSQALRKLSGRSEGLSDASWNHRIVTPWEPAGVVHASVGAGLLAGCPVFVAGNDALTSAIGAGLSEPGTCVEVTGSSYVAFLKLPTTHTYLLDASDSSLPSGLRFRRDPTGRGILAVVALGEMGMHGADGRALVSRAQEMIDPFIPVGLLRRLVVTGGYSRNQDYLAERHKALRNSGAKHALEPLWHVSASQHDGCRGAALMAFNRHDLGLAARTNDETMEQSHATT